MDNTLPNNAALSADQFLRLRQVVHRQLIDSIETDGAEILERPDSIRERIGYFIDEIGLNNGTTIEEQHRRRIEKQILEDLGGYGPLASLMVDPDISDILVNGPFEVWVDRNGRLSKTDVRFDNHDHLSRILDRLVAGQGRHLDANSPMVDAKLNDGSRLHAVIPPLCARGAVVSIRKFRVKPFSPGELVAAGFISQQMLDFLQAMVAARVNIVIAGGAAAGKTTLLNLISQFIPDSERIVTIEETAELRLMHEHVISLEGRTANSEGFGGIGLRQLVSTALRMRADRIIVGEVRGEEVLDMLQAMNVGHDGSLTTVHANSPEDVIRRLETLALTGASRLPRAAIQEMIGSAVGLIVQLARFKDGTRRVVNISAVSSQAGGLKVIDLFRFEAQASTADGPVTGQHVFTGARCELLERISRLGYRLSGNLAAGEQGEQEVAP